MDWRELDAMIREEKKAGNPVAKLVAGLQLDANRATLLLANDLDGGGEGGEVRAAPSPLLCPCSVPALKPGLCHMQALTCAPRALCRRRAAAAAAPR